MNAGRQKLFLVLITLTLSAWARGTADAAEASGAISSDIALLQQATWTKWTDADAARRRLAGAGAEAVAPIFTVLQENSRQPRGPWLESTLLMMAYEFRRQSDKPTYPAQAFQQALMNRELSGPARALAARLLGVLGDTSCSPALRAALNDKETAGDAARALGQIRAADAVSDLVQCARTTQEADALRPVIWSLGQINAAEAIPLLAELARSQEESVACAAVDALGAISAPSATEALKSIQTPASERVLQRIRLALLRHNVTMMRERGAQALSGEPGIACQGCHAQIFADFQLSSHKRKLDMSCDMCHGASDEHMVEYGKVKPEKELTKEMMPKFCAECHEDIKSHRDVVYDRLVGLDHRFQRRATAQAPEKVDAAKALGLVAKDTMPEDMKLLFHDDFEDGSAQGWTTIPEDFWRVEKVEDNSALFLTRGQRGKFSLGTMALIKDYCVSSFRFTVRAKCMAAPGAGGRDLCIVFGYTSDKSCYYVHFGAINSAGFNMIALIEPGQSRRLIRLEEKPEPRLLDQEWHILRVERNAESGVIKAYLDDMEKPLLTAVDKTHLSGLVGMGSLGDFGYFDDAELIGIPAKERRLDRAKMVMAQMQSSGKKKKASERGSPPPGMKLIFSDDFSNGAARDWKPKEGNNWKVIKDDDNFVYHLVEKGKQGRIRAPGAYSLIADKPVGKFTLIARARCLTPPSTRGRDVIVVFGYQDPEHFYYVHFSNASDQIHNSILKVDGKPREAIKNENSPIARLTTDDFHLLKVEHDPETGEIRAYIDDMEKPILTATDKTFTGGLVGVGSFDDTAYFDDVHLYVPK